MKKLLAPVAILLALMLAAVAFTVPASAAEPAAADADESSECWICWQVVKRAVRKVFSTLAGNAASGLQSQTPSASQGNGPSYCYPSYSEQTARNMGIFHSHPSNCI